MSSGSEFGPIWSLIILGYGLFEPVESITGAFQHSCESIHTFLGLQLFLWKLGSPLYEHSRFNAITGSDHRRTAL